VKKMPVEDALTAVLANTCVKDTLILFTLEENLCTNQKFGRFVIVFKLTMVSKKKEIMGQLLPYI